MPEVYSEQFFRAVQALMFAGIAGYAFKTARDAALNHGRWWSAIRCIGWGLGLALFASVVMGSPSCEEQGDPLRGGCEVYADDGYEPSLDDRIALFLFFALVLTIPALYGAIGVHEWEIAKRREERERWAHAHEKSDSN